MRISHVQSCLLHGTVLWWYENKQIVFSYIYPTAVMSIWLRYLFVCYQKSIVNGGLLSARYTKLSLSLLNLVNHNLIIIAQLKVIL